MTLFYELKSYGANLLRKLFAILVSSSFDTLHDFQSTLSGMFNKSSQARTSLMIDYIVKLYALYGQ